MEINGGANSPRKKKIRLNRKESDILTRSIPSTKADTKLIRSQIRKTGPLCLAGRKAPATVKKLEKEEEDIDLDKQFTEEDECNWLSSSSGCSSPSSFFQEYRISSSLHLSIDDWLISWLSTIADSYLHLNEAEKMNKIEEEKGELMELSDSENSGDISNSGDPLVWPSDRRSEWSSPETWRCFSMSPRKEAAAPDFQGKRRSSVDCSSEESACDSIESKLRVMKLNSCRKKLEFGLGDSDSKMEEIEEESIERVMGLGEFDGHEGVDSEFNSDVFTIDEGIDHV